MSKILTELPKGQTFTCAPETVYSVRSWAPSSVLPKLCFQVGHDVSLGSTPPRPGKVHSWKWALFYSLRMFWGWFWHLEENLEEWSHWFTPCLNTSHPNAAETVIQVFESHTSFLLKRNKFYFFSQLFSPKRNGDLLFTLWVAFLQLFFIIKIDQANVYCC